MAALKSAARRILRYFTQPVPGFEILKIILVCIASAVAYGIVHDQITARVCVEYFTIGHPPVFDTESPTLLAFGWGVIATWWAGAILGVPAALLAQVGSWPRYSARMLLRPIGVLLAVMAIAALLTGLTSFRAATKGELVLWEPLASEIEASRHAAFLADGGAHLASYTVGFLGGVVVCLWIALCRWQMAQLKSVPAPAPTPAT
jgi:hypothetical protein